MSVALDLPDIFLCKEPAKFGLVMGSIVQDHLQNLSNELYRVSEEGPMLSHNSCALA